MNRFNWQRAVIKVGSALIAPEGNECSGRYLLSLARFITASREAGKEIILVSSGSVAAGRSKVKVRHNASIAEKQAMEFNDGQLAALFRLSLCTSIVNGG